MKKTIVVVATIILALMMLVSIVACGSGGDTGGGGGSAPTTSTGQPSGTGGSSTPSSPAGSEPAEPRGPDGQEYGGMIRMIPSGTLNVPFGVVWHYLTSFRPSVCFAEALLLETPRGEMTPFLCTSWEPDVENKEVRFKLREDVTFADGSKFNAEVVAWHMEKWIEATLLDKTITGAEVRGEYEVAVKMATFGNWVPTILSARVCGFVSMEQYEMYGAEYAEQHPVGTGGFLLEEWVPGVSATWVRRDDYWQPGKPYADRIQFITMTDPMTQNAAMMTTGPEAVDFFQTGSAEQVATLLEKADVYISSMPVGPQSLFPSSNNPNSPLAIREVRQAIFYAIDRQSICDARGFGVWTPATQVFPDTFLGHVPENGEASYDPARSKELLAKAGFPNGVDITLYAPMSADRDTMVALQAMLGEVGININLEFPESGLAIELRTKGWEGLFVGGVRPLANMAHTLSYYFDPDYFYYPSMWRPESMTPLYYECRSTPYVEAPLMEQFGRGVMDEMLLIPIYDNYTNFVIRNDVLGGGFAAFGAGVEWQPEEIWRKTK